MVPILWSQEGGVSASGSGGAAKHEGIFRQQLAELGSSEKQSFVISLALSNGINWVRMDPLSKLWSSDDTLVNMNHEGLSLLSIGLRYKGFSIGSTSAQGELKAPQDIFASWFGRDAGLQAYYQRYAGFYLTSARSSTERLYPGTPQEYPDLELFNTGLNLFWFPAGSRYNFNFKEGYTQPTLGLTPYLLLKPGYFSLQSSMALLLPEHQGSFSSSLHEATSWESYQLSLNGGLALVLPLWRFYLAPAVYAGPQVAYSKASTIGSTTSLDDISLLPSYGIQMAVGYAGRHLNIGLGFINLLQSSSLEDLWMETANLQASFFASLRF
jgi:hypothetical protein